MHSLSNWAIALLKGQFDKVWPLSRADATELLRFEDRDGKLLAILRGPRKQDLERGVRAGRLHRDRFR
jgi:hypothetical protein